MVLSATSIRSRQTRGTEEFDYRRSGAGTAYDIYAQLLATYIGKYVPGNPSVVVQNMPAAGGMVAAICLRGCQAGWIDDRFNQPGALFQSAPRQQGSQIRLAEIHLDRKSRQVRTYALHAV